MFKEEAFVNGEWIRSSETFAVTNPATDELIASVRNLAIADATAAINAAINAAEAALPTWRNKLGKYRAQIMRKWFDLIIQNTQDLATLMTLEQGKPFPEAAGEVVYGASFVEWFAEEASGLQARL